MLQEVWQGCVSVKTIALLQSRVISTTVSAKYQELQDTAQSPVCLFPTKRACADFNNEMLSKLSSTPTKNCKILHSHLYAYFQPSVRVLISIMRC